MAELGVKANACISSLVFLSSCFLKAHRVTTPIWRKLLFGSMKFLQYSSQIVETDTASLEFSRKLLRITPHTFVFTVMFPLSPQCWATRILKHWDRCNAQINIGEGKTHTSVSRFVTRIVDLKQRRWRRQRERQKSKRFTSATFFAFVARLQRETS